MITQPPEHAADATPLYIAAFDDALDNDRIARERKELAKGEDHCTDRYYAGDTRYDVDAPWTIGGQAVTMRGYIRDGATPTVFKLRRVTGLLRQQTMAVINAGQNGGPPGDLVAAIFELAKHGVAEVTEGFAGTPWDLDGGQDGLPLTEGDLQTLYEAHSALPESLGWAVFHASKPLSQVEKKA